MLFFNIFAEVIYYAFAITVHRAVEFMKRDLRQEQNDCTRSVPPDPWGIAYSNEIKQKLYSSLTLPPITRRENDRLLDLSLHYKAVCTGQSSRANDCCVRTFSKPWRKITHRHRIMLSHDIMALHK